MKRVVYVKDKLSGAVWEVRGKYRVVSEIARVAKALGIDAGDAMKRMERGEVLQERANFVWMGVAGGVASAASEQ